MDEDGTRFKSRDAAPTVRQVYALARVLCDKASEEFPDTRVQASELIERLRREMGHPAPRVEDTPLRPRQAGRRRGRRGTNKFAAAVAARVVEELR